MLQDGIMVVPGTTMEKVLKCFEHFFGVAGIQKTHVILAFNSKTCHRNWDNWIQADTEASLAYFCTCPEIWWTSCSQ